MRSLRRGLSFLKKWHKWPRVPGGSASKESACNVGDLVLIPEFGWSPGEGNGYPLQYPCLENSMDCRVHRVAKTQIKQQLSFHFTNKLTYKLETALWISKTSLWLPLEKCWGRDTLGAWDKPTRLSCLTLCDSMDCGPTGPSIHGIFQVRILEWVAISCPRGSSWPRGWTCFSCVSCTGRWIVYYSATWEAHIYS